MRKKFRFPTVFHQIPPFSARSGASCLAAASVFSISLYPKIVVLSMLTVEKIDEKRFLPREKGAFCARKVKAFEKYKKNGEKRFDFQAKYCKIER